MHPVLIIFALSIFAYLLGSIPSSVWIGKLFFDTDIRQHGSGNAGTTNTFRVLGTIPGIVVFILDIFKGFIAVSLVRFAHQFTPGTNSYVNFQLVLGSLAVLGHIFPLYVGFKGGKGVATLLGLVLAIHPFAALIAFVVFSIMLAFTKYVSLSSMTAGLAFPFVIIFIFKVSVVSLIIFSILISILLIITHQKNIVRLLANEENKVRFSKDKSKFKNR